MDSGQRSGGSSPLWLQSLCDSSETILDIAHGCLACRLRVAARSPNPKSTIIAFRYRSGIGTACPRAHGDRAQQAFLDRVDDAGSISVAREARKVDYLRGRWPWGKRPGLEGTRLCAFANCGCSFCRKTEDQISKLVAGPRLFGCPRIYVCNECVAAASSIIEGNPPATSVVTRSLLQKVKERWRHLLQSTSRAVPTLP